MRKMIIVSTFLLFSTLYFFIYYQSQEPEGASVNISPISRVDIARWETYQNKNFSIRHPSDWFLVIEGENNWMFSSAPNSARLHGVGVPPSPHSWVDIIRGDCGDAALTNAFEVEKLGTSSHPAILQKTICKANSFIMTMGLWNNDPLKQEKEGVLEQIVATFSEF